MITTVDVGYYEKKCKWQVQHSGSPALKILDSSKLKWI